MIGGLAKTAGAGFNAYGDDRRDRVLRAMAERTANREENEYRARLGMIDAQRRAAEANLANGGPVTYKQDANGEYIALPTRLNAGEIHQRGGLSSVQAPGAVPPTGAEPPTGESVTGVPAVTNRGDGNGGVTSFRTGILGNVKAPPRAPASPTRTQQLSDGRRMVTQRNPSGTWDPALTATGDTVFAPSHAPREPKDAVLSAIKAAQQQVNAMQDDMRSTLARRPRASQYADPLTRMPDSTAMSEAMGNWRTDSTTQAGSLKAAQDELARLQSSAPSPLAGGGGRSAGGMPRPQGGPPALDPAAQMSRQAWAASNPPKPGESFDDYQRRYDAYAAAARRP